MKILFLTENFPPETNAAATRVFERACYWVEEGHDVTVITCAPNFPEGCLFAGYENKWRQVETVSGIRVLRVKTFITPNEGIALRTLDFMSFMITGFLAALFEKRPDVVVATSPQFFTAVAGWATAVARRLPFVFELSDLWPASIVAVGAMKENTLVRLLERLELFLYRRSASVIALTKAFKTNLVRRGIPADKIAVVLNGVDLPRYAPMPRDAALATEFGLESKFVVGYVGTHGMAHGLDNVLYAAERLRKDDRIRFMLAGPGATRESLIASARQRGLDNVVFLPPQPKSRMPAVWSLCNVALIHLRDDPVFAEVQLHVHGGAVDAALGAHVLAEELPHQLAALGAEVQVAVLATARVEAFQSVDVDHDSDLLDSVRMLLTSSTARSRASLITTWS